MIVSDIVRDSFRAYNSDNQQYQTIVVFECRGIEPTEFDFRVVLAIIYLCHLFI